MAEATFHFPSNFLFGAATASHQVEGNNTNNNWWAWEHESGRIINGDKSGLACDWWGGRWKEDFDRAADTGQNAHRLSIEWSRVQPTPDQWELGALDHYREMIRGLHERDMVPMVTLHHFSDPLWFSELGGWEHPDAGVYFSNYVSKVVEALQEYVSLWVTINEPNVLVVGAYILGDFPPGKRDFNTAQRVMYNLVQAHASAYNVIHQLQPGARVGIALNYRPFQPARSWSPLDRGMAGLLSNLFNEFFPRAFTTGKLRYPFARKRIPAAANTQDYLGINYYCGENVAFNLLRGSELFTRRFYPPEAELSETGMIANMPQGLFAGLKWAKSFNLPVYITENGVEDSADSLRPRYLVQHLHQVWRAVNFNYPIEGYFHWTLVDNFEWERGWTQRFGLWELDVETQARRKRPSADLYQAICRTKGISSQAVAEYAPELLPQMYPG
jgi:beta-glucosidase